MDQHLSRISILKIYHMTLYIKQTNKHNLQELNRKEKKLHQIK